MSLIPQSKIDTRFIYNLSHHCILKSSSNTMKLRVVFNASASISVGMFLNESMYTSPKSSPTLKSCYCVHDYRNMYSWQTFAKHNVRF